MHVIYFSKNCPFLFTRKKSFLIESFLGGLNLKHNKVMLNYILQEILLIVDLYFMPLYSTLLFHK